MVSQLGVLIILSSGHRGLSKMVGAELAIQLQGASHSGKGPQGQAADAEIQVRFPQQGVTPCSALLGQMLFLGVLPQSLCAAVEAPALSLCSGSALWGPDVSVAE